jgi:hypothetical protein
MARKMYQLDSVFGVSREVPLNYVAREQVDGLLLNYLDKKRHIVIHGGSKQGKTCLRKRCLGDACAVIQCAHHWTLADIHSQILKRAGYEVLESTTREGRQAGHLKLKARFPVGGAGLDAGIEGGRMENQKFSPLELDLNSAGDVIAALKAVGFSSYIVLEDFHYLKETTQAAVAFALKAYHEQSDYCFVIVGVWFDDDRVTAHNGDLTGRVVAINADAWSPTELRNVAMIGADLLNIELEDRFLTELVDASFGSVAVVQEACAALCRMKSVTETCQERQIVGGLTDAGTIIENVVRHHGGRYRNFLRGFGTGKGSGGSTSLHLHRWILFPFVTRPARDLEFGVAFSDLADTILGSHPDRRYVTTRALIKALDQATEVQAKCNIAPPIIAWDPVRERLSILDRGFLIWLGSQERLDLLQFSGLGEWV